MSRYDVWRADRIQKVQGYDTPIVNFVGVEHEDVGLEEAKNLADNKRGLFVVEHVNGFDWKVHYE